jgi:excisionase family DNA binding protein
MTRPAIERDLPQARPLLYTAQDVARFCEVDLKTIHHWADAGKIAHHRTEGRHLRFRRNHLVRFLLAHGYPLHDELASARPSLFAATEHVPEDVAKKLASRFFVRRFDNALVAIANLVAAEPDALLVHADDPTWTGAGSISALKSHVDTSWTAIVVVGCDPSDARAEGADLVLAADDLGRLGAELARTLSVS